MDEETVELGVALLERLEHEQLTVAEAVDRIETVTTNPTLTREILDRAEMRGVVEREDGIVRPQRGTYVRFESQVVQRDGEFECARCGAGLSVGHFVQLEEGEIGPFGGTCIRKVTGRE